MGFQCKKCEKTFSLKSKLRIHMIQVHEEKKCFSCRYCDTEMPLNGNEYVLHLKSHKKAEAIKCDKCEQAFSYKKSLALHKKRYHPEIPRLKPKCNRCQRQFCDKKTYEKHMKGCGKNEIECDICDKTFDFESNLLRHKTMAHNEKSIKQEKEDEIECDFCDRFIKVSKLDKHFSGSHKMKKSIYKCDMCEKPLWSKNMMDYHIKHEHEEHIECDFCDKSIKVSKLEKHFTVDHNMKKCMYKCNICEKPLWSNNVMDYHFNNEHGGHGDSANDFKCSHCNSNFMSESSLKLHIDYVHDRTKIET